MAVSSLVSSCYYCTYEWLILILYSYSIRILLINTYFISIFNISNIFCNNQIVVKLNTIMTGDLALSFHFLSLLEEPLKVCHFIALLFDRQPFRKATRFSQLWGSTKLPLKRYYQANVFIYFLVNYIKLLI